MDFLRRVLGRSADSSVPSGDVSITIMKDAELPTSPPEPTIDPPARAEQKSGKKDSMRASSDERVTPSAPFDAAAFAGTRPLPPLETVVPKPGERLVFGQLSDVGMVRSNNQDAMFSLLASSSSTDDLPDFGLFIVADGMGGHHDGEKASAITARIVTKHVIDEIFVSLLDQKMNDPDRPSIAEVLRVAVEKANEAVTEEIPEGGTTVTATVILGDLAYIAHVGDSRAYLISDDGIEQVTRDHSLVQRLIELDQLTPEEALDHPQRNVLYRAIGQSETLDVDAITRRLPPRSRLLLCSDGLWNLVPEDAMLDIVRKNKPQDACDHLIRMANDRGGPDNITVILVQVPG
jgi:serine/threonine protein phosphatase PrpC